MIYVRAKTDPVLFVFLTHADVKTKLERGNTLFVDRKMLQGMPVDHVVISLHPDHESIVKMIHSADPLSTGLPITERKPGPESEEQCQGCQAIVQIGQLFEGRCIVCWSTMAKTYATQNQFLQSQAATAKGSS